MMKFLHSRLLLSLTFFVAISFSSMAQTTIEEYYQNATGKTGSELKTALHLIIKGHTELPYTSKESTDEYNVWEALKITDEDPNNTDNVLLIYTNRSEVKTHQDDGSNDPDSWNREHIWAKSHGDFGTDRGAGTDIHHLRPCDRSVNTSRSNKFFDDGGNPHSEATECNFDNDSWEPRDAVKGDIARMIFYMTVRYEGEGDEPDLELTNDMSLHASSLPYHGKKETLLLWNSQDPVDDAEKARNEKIYTIQGNRNPFINHPEWVSEIWAPDTKNPEVSELSPANGSDGISLTANCIIKFNEDIAEGTGSVTIKRYNDDSVFETLTVPSARLSYTSNQLLINPEAKFEEGTKYYVIIDNGVITDASSNVFGGISDKAIWNFTTTFAPPAITKVTPADNSVSIPVNTELKITFDKNVQAGNGNISIQTSGNEIMRILASTTAINGETVTIQLSQELESSTEYSVLIDENAFQSENGVAFAGITSDEYWNFSTELITGIEDIPSTGTPSFFPNPAVSEIRLTNMDDIESISISDLTGRKIMELKSPDKRISLTNLPEGMYLVTFVSDDGSRVTKKLLKQ